MILYANTVTYSMCILYLYNLCRKKIRAVVKIQAFFRMMNQRINYLAVRRREERGMRCAKYEY